MGLARSSGTDQQMVLVVGAADLPAQGSEELVQDLHAVFAAVDRLQVFHWVPGRVVTEMRHHY